MSSTNFSPSKSLSNQPILISIEGNIGAGKSTFLKIMNNIDISYEFIDEPVAEWQAMETSRGPINFLELFYEDPYRWAYSFQSCCLLTRIKALCEIKKQVFTQKDHVLLLERSLEADKYIFAKNFYINGEFKEIEWMLYNEYYEFFTNEIGLKMDGIIYLKTSVDTCFERLQKRKRLGEETIGKEYLTQLHERHEEWLNFHDNVLFINTDKEFENDPVRQNEIVNDVKNWINEIKYKKSETFC